MNPRIAYCWELGMGFGHVSRMDNVANNKSLLNCDFTYILREVHRGEIIESCNMNKLFQAPILNIPVKGASPNFSHLMGRCGWADTNAAIYLTSAWRNIFRQIKPDVVLLDHSPSAGIAALSMDIPVRSIGNGFEIPPVADPMPSMQLHMQSDDKILRAQDAKLNKVLNDVEYKFCGTRNQKLSLANLFNAEHSLITGFPCVDHYGERDNTWQYLYQATKPALPYIDLAGVGNTGKPLMFFYLDSRTENLAGILEILSSQFELFGYLSYLNEPSLVETLASKGIKVFSQLLNIEQAFTLANAVFCNAGVGMLNNVIEYKKPALIMPLQVEQNMVAFQLHTQGLAWVVNPQNALNQLRGNISRMHENLPSLVNKISDYHLKSAYQSKMWQGDLLRDFLRV